MKEIKKCKVKGCEGKHEGKGYCNRHYQQMYHHGRIRSRTLFDKNEIITYENYAEVVLYNSKCEEVCRTIIDLEDVEFCSHYKWGLNNRGYACVVQCYVFTLV